MMSAAAFDQSTLNMLRLAGGFGAGTSDQMLNSALAHSGGNVQRAIDLVWSMMQATPQVRPVFPPPPMLYQAFPPRPTQGVSIPPRPAAAPIPGRPRPYPGPMPRPMYRTVVSTAAPTHPPLVLPPPDVVDITDDAPPMKANKEPEVINMLDDDGIVCIDDGNVVDLLQEVPVSIPKAPPTTWPKQLRPFVITTTSSIRGVFPALHTTPLTFWLEGTSELGPATMLKTPSGSGRPKKAITDYDSSYLDVAVLAQIRFGLTSPTSGTPVGLGKFPVAVSRFMVPLMEEQLIEVQGNVIYAKSIGLEIGNDLILSLVVLVKPEARRLMRITATDTINTGADAEDPGRALKATAKSLRLRAAIFELFYYSFHGDFAPKPQKTQSKTAAPVKKPTSPAEAAPVDAKAVETGADNAEEQVSAEVVKEIIKEETAPRVPLADQPALLRNITLRPYQRQALSWMVARELGVEPEGMDPTEFEIAAGQAPLLQATEDEQSSTTAQEDHASTAAAATTVDDGCVIVSSSSATHALVRNALERGSKSVSMASLASMWEKFTFTDGFSVYLNVYTRVVSLSPPPQARPCRGGILADEMGLGKTAEFCSLVLAMKERSGFTVVSGVKRKEAPTAEAPARPRRRRRRRLMDEDEEGETLQADEDDEAAGLMGDDVSDVYEPRIKRERVRRQPSKTASDVGKQASTVDADTSQKDEDNSPLETDEESRLPAVHATLVVCPMVMMGQWKREAEKYTAITGAGIQDLPFRVAIHYGTSRLKSVRDIEQYDMVVTSFGVLASEYDDLQAALEKEDTSNATSYATSYPALYSVCWQRVALDEAHTIRNRTTKIARACFELESKCRWALTGTPIQNSLQDLYSLLRFLKHEPWSELLWWKHVISDPFAKGDPLALSALQSLLQPILLRRTKQMKDLDGSKIGDLAPADIRIVPITLFPEERVFYDQLYKRSKIRFQDFVASGNVLSHFAQIFTLLLRLRQACLHPFLVIASLNVSNTAAPTPTAAQSSSTPASSAISDDVVTDPEAITVTADSSIFSNEFLNNLYMQFLTRANNNTATAAAANSSEFLSTQIDNLRTKGVKEEECPVCLEPLERAKACILSCAHLVCYACANRVVKPSSTCPVCRCFIKADDILDLSPTQKAAAAAAKASKELPSFNFQRLTRETLLGDGGDMPWRMSSKLEYLLTDLAAIKQHNDAARRFKRTKQTPSADVDELEARLESQLSQTVAGMFLEGPVRVVVFSSFTFMLDLIEKCCKTERLSYARLDGSMSQPQREASLKAFRSDADTFVMLISLKAGGLGLNLTEASIVYLMDPWWNPSQEHQALSRVHRLGQEKQVYVKRLIASETIEESMLDIQKRKQQIARSALSASASMDGNKLSEEELRMFFRR